MMKPTLLFLVFTIALFQPTRDYGIQSELGAEVVTCPQTTEDLANTLAKIAWLSHLPMVAEVAQPLPNIVVPEGLYVVKDLLEIVARQAPGYQWDAEGRIVHFYNQRLRNAKYNFLGIKFQRFIMPPNVSELKLTFPTLENALLEGLPSDGYFISGFGDAALEKARLAPATLTDVTGREVLLRTAKESPTFFTIIVFPNSDPTKKQMELDMNRNWFWQPLGDNEAETLYIKPPAGAM
jgi:hypothetical protein